MCTTSARPYANIHRVHAASPDPAQRVGDRERERAAGRLGLAFTQGYLSMEEYEDRLAQAFSAEAAGDLESLTSDLPLAEISRRDPRRLAANRRAAKRGLQFHLIGYVTLCLLMIGIWLAVGIVSGSWYFWPIWPIMGVGVGVVAHSLSITRAGSGVPAAAAMAGLGWVNCGPPRR